MTRTVPVYRNATLTPQDPSSNYPTITVTSTMWAEFEGQNHMVYGSAEANINLNEHVSISLNLYNDMELFDHYTYYSYIGIDKTFTGMLSGHWSETDWADCRFIYTFVGYSRYTCRLEIQY